MASRLLARPSTNNNNGAPEETSNSNDKESTTNSSNTMSHKETLHQKSTPGGSAMEEDQNHNDRLARQQHQVKAARQLRAQMEAANRRLKSSNKFMNKCIAVLKQQSSDSIQDERNGEKKATAELEGLIGHASISLLLKPRKKIEAVNGNGTLAKPAARTCPKVVMFEDTTSTNRKKSKAVDPEECKAGVKSVGQTSSHQQHPPRIFPTVTTKTGPKLSRFADLTEHSDHDTRRVPAPFARNLSAGGASQKRKCISFSTSRTSKTKDTSRHATASSIVRSVPPPPKTKKSTARASSLQHPPSQMRAVAAAERDPVPSRFVDLTKHGSTSNPTVTLPSLKRKCDSFTNARAPKRMAADSRTSTNGFIPPPRQKRKTERQYLRDHARNGRTKEEKQIADEERRAFIASTMSSGILPIQTENSDHPDDHQGRGLYRHDDRKTAGSKTTNPAETLEQQQQQIAKEERRAFIASTISSTIMTEAQEQQQQQQQQIAEEERRAFIALTVSSTKPSEAPEQQRRVPATLPGLNPVLHGLPAVGSGAAAALIQHLQSKMVADQIENLRADAKRSALIKHLQAEIASSQMNSSMIAAATATAAIGAGSTSAIPSWLLPPQLPQPSVLPNSAFLQHRQQQHQQQQQQQQLGNMTSNLDLGALHGNHRGRVQRHTNYVPPARPVTTIRKHRCDPPGDPPGEIL